MSDEFDKTQPQSNEDIQARHAMMLRELYQACGRISQKYAVSTVEMTGILETIKTSQIVDGHLEALQATDENVDQGVLTKVKEADNGDE
jgi:hypothetical protein